MMVADRSERRRAGRVGDGAPASGPRRRGWRHRVSAGGTGTYDLHATTGVTEVQAGSYALMDTHYGTLGLPFEQARLRGGHGDLRVARLGGRRRRPQVVGDGPRQPLGRSAATCGSAPTSTSRTPRRPAPGGRRARAGRARTRRPDDGDARRGLAGRRRRGARPLADRPPRLVSSIARQRRATVSARGRRRWRVTARRTRWRRHRSVAAVAAATAPVLDAVVGAGRRLARWVVPAGTRGRSAASRLAGARIVGAGRAWRRRVALVVAAGAATRPAADRRPVA